MESAESAEWAAACAAKFASLQSMGVWDLVDLPVGWKAINSKWVFNLKRDERGEVVRYKARLVAKGFRQIAGVDLAAIHNLDAQQLDVITAYLNGTMNEEMFMHQAEGFVEPGMEMKVCRLKKALYGLESDDCLYTLAGPRGDLVVIVLVYVDD